MTQSAQMAKIAMGHSSITTTERAYLRTANTPAPLAFTAS